MGCEDEGLWVDERGKGGLRSEGDGMEWGLCTMLPAWSLKAMPLVFIILIYGLLILLIEKPCVWGQGADMSLRTTWGLTRPVSR